MRYGTKASPVRYMGRPYQGIDNIDQSPGGNIFLSIGEENRPFGVYDGGSHSRLDKTWRKIAHVVLTPEETRELIMELADKLGETAVLVSRTQPGGDNEER